MKPKMIEWIPFYGMGKYYDRYIIINKQGNQDAIIAQWFSLYHHITSLIIVFILLKYFKLF